MLDLSPYEIVIRIPGLLLALTLHEFGHAIVATWFGDDTPRHQGRVTLNPLAHLDVLGTILFVVAGYGWAKPVQVNTARLRPRVLGDIAVSLAGVVMNFFLAIIALTAFYLLRGEVQEPITDILRTAAELNIVLIALNLLPLPPLDGFHVARHLLPRSMDGFVEQAFRYGPFLLMFLFISGAGRAILRPVANFFADIIVTVSAFLAGM